MAQCKDKRQQEADAFFSEIYSKYFLIVEKILRYAQKGRLQLGDVSKIVCADGFAESNIYITEKLRQHEWPLLLDDMTTPLRKPVARPLSILEKRWLKALLLDPRIRLFDVDEAGLEDIEPLLRPEQLVYFDQYTDGDAYNDAAYQQHFKTLLHACEQKRLVEIGFTNNRGEGEKHVYLPLKLEYSAKDDKFRLRAEQLCGEALSSTLSLVNLGRITECSLLEKYVGRQNACRAERSTIVLELTDERNALERVLLHFSTLEKKTQKIDATHYRLYLSFNKSDWAEMVIRVLSFGPLLRLVAPDRLQDAGLLAEQTAFWNELRSRLSRQRTLLRARADVRPAEGRSR